MIVAEVEGTEVYDVRIDLSVDGMEMCCTCPYADSGEACKHMAAVLIVADSITEKSCDDEISKQKKPVGWMDVPSLKVEYEQQLNMMKEHMKLVNNEELVDFVARQLIENEAMKRSYVARFASSEIDVKEMIREFARICRRHEGRDGFINYRLASGFFSELDDFVSDLVVMFDDGLVVECTSVITAITLGFDELPLDDSDGGTQVFYEGILELVESILNQDVKEANELLYLWMHQVNEDPASWYLKECLYPIWSNRFSDEELIDREIELHEKKRSKYLLAKTDHASNYEFICCLMELVKLKEQRKDSDLEIMRIIKPYEAASEVTWYLIKRSQIMNDIQEEERLINSGLANSTKQHYIGLMHRYKEALCDLYRRSGRSNAYRMLLKEMVIENYTNLTYYHAYKACFDDESWKIEVMDIINTMESKVRYGRIMADIFVEEKMADRLFEWLKKGQSIDVVRRYQGHLGNEYKEDIMKLLIDGLDRLSSPSGSVSHYINIVSWMKYIKSLDGGKKVIDDKINEYRMKYNRRPNFIKELNKIIV